jgi:hypothetical protein
MEHNPNMEYYPQLQAFEPPFTSQFNVPDPARLVWPRADPGSIPQGKQAEDLADKNAHNLFQLEINAMEAKWYEKMRNLKAFLDAAIAAGTQLRINGGAFQKAMNEVMMDNSIEIVL